MQAGNAISKYANKPHAINPLAENLDLLQRFANLRDEDAEKFRVEHPEFLLLPQLRSSGWKSGVRLRYDSPRAIERAKEMEEEQPNPVLRHRDMLRKIWRGHEHANDWVKLLLYSSLPTTDRVAFNLKRGEIVYVPNGELETVVFSLFRNSSLAKICEADDCPSPYFIAKRRNQRYCSAACSDQAQKQLKLDWWKREGSRRRREQQKANATKRNRKGKR
jgi:hypothetical protein